MLCWLIAKTYKYILIIQLTHHEYYYNFKCNNMPQNLNYRYYLFAFIHIRCHTKTSRTVFLKKKMISNQSFREPCQRS